MKEIIVYGAENCKPCSQTYAYLDARKIYYEKIPIKDIDSHSLGIVTEHLRDCKVTKKPRPAPMPRIFVGGMYIGSLLELKQITNRI